MKPSSLGLALAAWLICGCDLNNDTQAEEVTCDADAVTTTTQTIQAEVINVACKSCHGPVGPGPIDMSTAQLSHDNMIGKTSETYSANLKLVEPGNLATSIVWLKVAGGLRGPKGERVGGVMPPAGNPKLTAAQLKQLKDWICTGATQL